jgi:hypothetical protein
MPELIHFQAAAEGADPPQADVAAKLQARHVLRHNHRGNCNLRKRTSERTIIESMSGIYCRAEKYGTAKPSTDFSKLGRKPGPVRDELRKARLTKKVALVTGFDLFSEEERAKQNVRAARFGTAAPVEGVAIARLSESEQAKKNRAQKFGVQYEEVERSGTRERAEI